MPKRTNPLDRINIASPCSSDWDDMIGNDQVRFCQHCSLFVHDLSKITTKEALKIVADSKGKLCVRYVRRPDGTVETARRAQPVTQIKRRLSRIAVGAFTATLSLAANAAAQSYPTAARSESAIVEPSTTRDSKRPVEFNGTPASLTGMITDPQQAVILRAKVTLTNTQTEQELSTTTNDMGEYYFQSVQSGTYKLKIEAPGFAVYQQDQINLTDGGQERVDVKLDVAVVTLGGAVAIVPDTPLVKAIWYDEIVEVRNLLAQGVDVNVLDKNTDSTALFESVAQGKLEIVNALISAGADPNVKNSTGLTALMRLSEDSSAEIVRALVDVGAKVNHKDADGDTPLHMAAALEKTEILRALLDAGAKVNARNNDGKTALMIAAENGYLENVRALLWAGADVHRRDKDGATALKYAQGIEDEEESDEENDEGEQSNAKREIISLLMAYGAYE